MLFTNPAKILLQRFDILINQKKKGVHHQLVNCKFQVHYNILINQASRIFLHED